MMRRFACALAVSLGVLVVAGPAQAHVKATTGYTKSARVTTARSSMSCTSNTQALDADRLPIT